MKETTIIIHPTVTQSQKEWLEKKAKAEGERISFAVRKLIREAMQAEQQATEVLSSNLGQ